MDFTFFFKPQHEHGVFSNWFRQDMDSPAFPGIRFATLEKWMMYQKALTFQDYDIAKQILGPHGPDRDKRLGQQVSGFSEDIWRAAMPKIVCEGVRLKYSIPDMRTHLMSTRHTTLVEASPYDKNYGIKMDKHNIFASSPDRWQGSNLLGFYLTDHRIHLSETLPQYEPEDPEFIAEYQAIRKSVLERLPILGKATPTFSETLPLKAEQPRSAPAIRRVGLVRKLSAPPVRPPSPMD